MTFIDAIIIRFCVSVGSSGSNIQDIGDLSSFSSLGPTADNRIKPGK